MHKDRLKSLLLAWQEEQLQGREVLFLVGRSPEAHLALPEDPYFSRQHFLVEINPPLCCRAIGKALSRRPEDRFADVARFRRTLVPFTAL